MSKVSIIVPVYNGEKYLKKCLDSVINQTLEDIEIVCVNDCSTDKSLVILQEYAEKDKRVKIIDLPENKGHCAAKNIALNEASGNYIMFLDNDDWLETDACELLFNQAFKNKNDFVMFDFNHYYADKNEYKQSKIRIEPFKDLIDEPNIRLYELKNNFIRSCWAWCYMYRREFLISNDIRFPEQNRQVDDVPFIIKAYVSADTISIIDKPLYNHYENSESITYTRYDLWYEFFDAREEGLRYILESKNTKAFLKPYIVYYVRSIMYWYKRFADSRTFPYVIKKSFYEKMSEVFKVLEKYDVDYKQDIDYDLYKWYKSAPYWLEALRMFQRNFLAFRESGDKTCYCLILFGYKIIIRK